MLVRINRARILRKGESKYNLIRRSGRSGNSCIGLDRR